LPLAIAGYDTEKGLVFARPFLMTTLLSIVAAPAGIAGASVILLAPRGA
jgi:hypothetical protein